MFSTVKPTTGIVPNIHEIVVDKIFVDKSALCKGDEIIHTRCKTQREKFGNNFGEGMDEDNGAVVGEYLCFGV